MFQIPTLKYKYSDLEPYIDEETMRIHHTKHHQTYVDKLNAALEKYPDLMTRSIDEILRDTSQVPSEVRQTVINNGGGHYNHCRFWEALAPAGGEPGEKTLAMFDKYFGGLEGFKEKFKTASLNHFGSGWTWLVADKDSLAIVTSINQDTPWSTGRIPLLTLDLWEHAYYLKYQNRRAEYVDNFFHIINWQQVEENIANKG